MTSIDWRIPPSMHAHLAELPCDRPVAMLIRHSVRDHLPPGEAGYMLPITEVGERLARELGGLLGARLRSLHASPLLRTMQTATRLAEGAGLRGVTTREDRLLGDPGAFVLDNVLAGAAWRELGHEAVMAHLVADDGLPGLAAPDAAARFLVRHMLAQTDSGPGIHAFVTHDSLITATAARLLDAPLAKDDWPWYLEAAFFWDSGDGVEVRYRGRRAIHRGALCTLDDRDVLDFARREIAATVGLDFPGRFFLSGGAFKSLLTGRPPRDLDFWAPTPADREALVERLQQRGAEPLPRRAYSEAWALAGRVVEVPDKAEPDTLEARQARYDIALSAVGVEHRNGESWRALVHPLARESMKRQEVLLLKPLANPKYALTSLERLRRYAAELDFRVPPEEEALLWAVWDQATAEERARLLNRFERTARHDQGVGEEVACRLR